MANKITPRSEDYSKWYNDIVQEADLAENSGVRGCMVIKPYGFAIWEKMQAELDKMFKQSSADKMLGKPFQLKDIMQLLEIKEKPN